MTRPRHLSWIALAAFGLVAFSTGSAAAANKKPKKKPAAEQPAAAPVPPPAADPTPPPAPAPAPAPAITKPTTEAAASVEPDAKPDAPKKTTFDVAPAFVLPVGNFSDVTGVGFGALAGVRHQVAKNVDITGRAGFVYHLSKDFGPISYGTAEIPLLPGVRYTFVPANGGGFYGGAELGLTVVFVRASSPATNSGGFDVPAQTNGDSSVKVSTALNLGYQVGKIDARATMYFVDLGHAGDTMALMASVGYSFAEL